MSDRFSRLLEFGFVRNAAGPTHLTMFVVAAVSTVLLTRGLLALTGWPQLGGGSLHIAHILYGGALMLVALFLLLAFIGPVIRPVAAFIGGVGFGLFIDEVGKFVTADNDYFFRPAAAIMYVVFVLIVLAIQAVHGHRLDPREHLANAADHAVEGLAGGLSHRRRELASAQLAAAGDVPGHHETAALVAACRHEDSELPAVSERIRDLIDRIFDQLSSHPRATRGIVIVVVAQAVLVPANQVVDRMRGVGTWTDLPFIGVTTGSAIGAVLAAAGIVLLRKGDQKRAWRAFQLCVLSFLLVVRVFTLAHDQFGATAGVLIDLATLGAIGAKRESLRHAEEARLVEAEGALQPSQRAGAPPGGTTEEREHSRDQQPPHDRRVDDDRDQHADPENLHEGEPAQRERADDDHQE